MANIDQQGRPEPPLDGDEVATLLGFLDYQRATLEWKCRGLDSGSLRTRVAASSMTLGGLLTHLAFAEDHWLSYCLHGSERRPPWDGADWSSSPDWDWDSAASRSPEELRGLWRDAVERSRGLVAQALATDGLGQLARRSWPNGEAPSLRWIIVHLIEEYARHNGHADLLREAVDGETGE